MRKKLLAGLTGLLLFSAPLFAQVSKDSIKYLKQQKDALEVGKRLNENKLKLAELENKLEKTVKEAKEASEDADKYAGKNRDAASDLAKNPQDRKAAKRARQAARTAEKRARQARNKAEDLKDLQDDIDKLKKKIDDDNSKMSQYSSVIGGM